MTGDAINFSLSTDPKYVTTKDAFIQAKAIIIATGRGLSKAKMIPGEEKFLGMGVSYCATCDGPLFRGQSVVALGNSDEAAEDILALKGMDCDVRWIPGGRERCLEDLRVRVKDSGLGRRAGAHGKARGVLGVASEIYPYNNRHSHGPSM